MKINLGLIIFALGIFFSTVVYNYFPSNILSGLIGFSLCGFIMEGLGELIEIQVRRERKKDLALRERAKADIETLEKQLNEQKQDN